MTGVPRYVVNLVEHLARNPRAGVEFVALTSEEVHPRLRAAVGDRCLEVCRAPRFRWNEERFRFEQVVLPRTLARLGVDLYHATWNHGVPLVSPVPAVLTVHDLMGFTHPAETDPGSRLRRLCYRASMRISVARARRVIAVSRTTAREVTVLLGIPPYRVSVTHEAPDDRFHRPVLAEEVAAAGIEGSRRPDSLSVEEFIRLANASCSPSLDRPAPPPLNCP